MTQRVLSLLQKFAQESADALVFMKATGTGHELDDVRVYFAQLKKHRQGHGRRPETLESKAMH